MARLVLTELADGDLAVIANYLASEAGIAVAERYVAAFDDLLSKLIDFPGIGTRRPALGDDVRIGVVSPYIVIYAFDASADVITVLRVIHGRRDITRKLIGGR
jgi:plasmid stabilization system protein ParE